MKDEREISDRARTTRFYQDQVRAFAELEKLGINVSHVLRKSADIAIKEFQFLANQNKSK